MDALANFERSDAHADVELIYRAILRGFQTDDTRAAARDSDVAVIAIVGLNDRRVNGHWERWSGWNGKIADHRSGCGIGVDRDSH